MITYNQATAYKIGDYVQTQAYFETGAYSFSFREDFLVVQSNRTSARGSFRIPRAFTHQEYNQILLTIADYIRKEEKEFHAKAEAEMSALKGVFEVKIKLKKDEIISEVKEIEI